MEGMMPKLKLQSFGHLMRRVDSLEKTDAGRDWGQEEKGTTEDEMAEWCHQQYEKGYLIEEKLAYVFLWKTFSTPCPLRPWTPHKKGSGPGFCDATSGGRGSKGRACGQGTSGREGGRHRTNRICERQQRPGWVGRGPRPDSA